MRRTSRALPLLLAALAAAPAAAQIHTATADPADVASIEAMMSALYDVISGPAGERDWHRLRSLFLPGAFLMPAAPRADSLPPPAALSPDQFREQSAPYFRENPFYEEEATRRVERFGTIAHVWSTYLSRHAPGEAPVQRGINSVQLVWHQGRWWIASIVWDAERPDSPIPPRYLPPGA